MSYLEIYNENIRDLLDPSSGYLELRDESKGRNIQVPLTDFVLISTLCFLGLWTIRGDHEKCWWSHETFTKRFGLNLVNTNKNLALGNKERTQEPTAANKTSSRSHALLMVNVRQTVKSSSSSRGGVKTGRWKRMLLKIIHYARLIHVSDFTW